MIPKQKTARPGHNMKTLFNLLASFHLLSFICLSSFAQGSLTPPGAPAPLFKTLDQLEPRIAVQSLAGDATAQFVITQPGSYYLTGNVTGVVAKAAIAIVATNVSLDLRGFALIGISGAPHAPTIAGAASVTSGTSRRTWLVVNGLPTTGAGSIEVFGNPTCGDPDGSRE